MKGLLFCVFVIMMLTPAQGEEEEQLMELEGLKPEESYLECFRCDLGFWDACYTTETNCSRGELCYTGRGKAADSLDIKTLGCAKAEECNAKTTVALFLNNTIFIMTKSCCDTPFCNSAQELPIYTVFQITLAGLTISHITKALVG
ncbi:sperm acrosome membrane-associated protein 4-like [Xiphophorus maculatus]|nr:sperm acrosome membrane-associated protein 4-like [Xiphophorus maculatus]